MNRINGLNKNASSAVCGRSIFYPLLLLICWNFGGIACNNEDAPPESPAVAERTVLVWLAGDNNLSAEVPRKIAALAEGYHAAATGGGSVRLIVYADRYGEYPKLLEISPRGELQVLETYPAQNSASGETLRRMLTTMMERCPARRYGLIVFSHATGWLPQGALENPENPGWGKKSDQRSGATRTIFDDNGCQMEITEFARALPLLEDNEKYDYIVFENCLMAGVEVAYELRDKAERLLVSSAEILSPGFEEVYPSALSCLLAPEADLRAFARSYYDYRNGEEGTYRSATVSVIRTEPLQELAAAVRIALTSAMPLCADRLTLLQRFNRHRHTLFFDLEEYMEAAAPGKTEEVHNILSRTVEYAAATPGFMTDTPYGFEIRRHCGLTVYIPQAEYPELNERYEVLAWSRAAYPVLP